MSAILPDFMAGPTFLALKPEKVPELSGDFSSLSWPLTVNVVVSIKKQLKRMSSDFFMRIVRLVIPKLVNDLI